ncbi:MAG TPA: DUF6265 family protein [Hyphomonadaceae bacterium]|nr:DUF6265 family protein [Hyphomonadaceae bacterium]
MRYLCGDPTVAGKTMQSTSRILAAIAAAAALSACATTPKQDLGPLAFMVGCWQSADLVNKEVWSPPEQGLMFGYATTTKGGKLDSFEQSRIDVTTAKPTYTASPDGQRPVVFTATAVPPPPSKDGKSATAPTVTFENAEHDYPQRITYFATGKGGLGARISKLDGSRAIDYSWAPCKAG